MSNAIRARQAASKSNKRPWLAGLVIFVGFYYFLRALATASVSIVAPIFRLNFIVTAALALSARPGSISSRRRSPPTWACAARTSAPT